MAVIKNFSIAIVGAAVLGISSGKVAQAQFTYMEQEPTGTSVNNTAGTAEMLPGLTAADLGLVIGGTANPATDPIDFYSLMGTTNEILRVSVSSPSLGADPTISLFNSSGTQIIAENDPGPFADFAYMLATNDTYFLSYTASPNAPIEDRLYGLELVKDIATQQVPESSPALGLLALGALGVGAAVRGKLKHKQILVTQNNQVV